MVTGVFARSASWCDAWRVYLLSSRRGGGAGESVTGEGGCEWRVSQVSLVEKKSRR